MKEQLEMAQVGRRLLAVARACALIGLASSAAFAQSETQIVQGVNGVLSKVVYVVGPAVLGFGLIRGFLAYGAGDEDGMITARNAVIGGLGILFTFTIVKVVVQASGVVF